jgi:hypothetical protein
MMALMVNNVNDDSRPIIDDLVSFDTDSGKGKMLTRRYEI